MIQPLEQGKRVQQRHAIKKEEENPTPYMQQERKGTAKS